MDLVENSFDVCCEECGDRISIFRDELEMDKSFYLHGEYGMGIEWLYTIEHEIVCPVCGNPIKICIQGSEYPEGAFNFSDAEISGAEFIEKPMFGILYYRDEFDVDICAIESTVIRKLILQISKNKNLIYKVSPREFEQIVEQLLQNEGFETHLTPQTRDGGKDIVAIKRGINGKPIVFYVECKRYAQENKVGVEIVHRLYGVQTAEKVNKACIITTSGFTSGAIKWAKEQNVMIDLVDGDALHNMIIQCAQRYE